MKQAVTSREMGGMPGGADSRPPGFLCNSFPPRPQLTGVIAKETPDHWQERKGAKGTLRELARPIKGHKLRMCRGLNYEHRNNNETLMQTD